MLRFITLLALFGCALAGTVITERLAGRIVGGVETTIQEHPYQISMKSKTTGRHVCGGSIYNENTIITAAHCVMGTKASNIYIRLGSTNHATGGKSVNVESITIHPGYNARTFVNDVAILKLDEKVAESNEIKYIQLADETPENGADAIVTGWGTECFQKCPSSVNILRKVVVQIVDLATCGSNKYSYGSSITSSMVCAQALGKDACQGDSGGPLVVDGKLVGVVSWGNGCAFSSYPGVYADVAYLRGWIEKTVAAF